MKRNWQTLKNNALGAIPNALLSIIAMAWFYFFPSNNVLMLSVLSVVGILWELYHNYKARILPKRLIVIRQGIIGLFWYIIILYITEFFGGYGILGLIISSVLIALIIIYKRWKIYIETVRGVEKIVFGKTLDKEDSNDRSNKPTKK